MSRKDRLIKDLRNNPNNVKFADIKQILEDDGWTLASVKGSHHKFKKPNHQPLIIPFNKPIKPFYVNLVLDTIGE